MDPVRLKTLATLLRGENLPAVVVDLDAFDQNLREIAGWVKSASSAPKLRLASKSIRVPSLIKRVLQSGSPYQGIMSYSAQEAALLAREGLDDFLIAYPTAQGSDIGTLLELHREGKQVRLVVDSVDLIQRVDAAARAAGLSAFPLALEVDLALRFGFGRVHLGARRSPVRSVSHALEIFEATRGLSGIRLDGIMGYESQVAGVADRNPVNRMMNPAIRLVRSLSVRRIARFRSRLAEALRERAFPLTLFNGGGTGSLSYSLREPCLTEVTAGSGFLQPHLFDWYSNFQLTPACFFALQAVRIPDPRWVTCQGGGYIASGKPGWDKTPVPVYPPGCALSLDEGCGEVQTPVRLPRHVVLAPGDPVLFRHAKGGELAERFREYLLVSGEKIVERVPTYRGLGECFF